MPRSALSNRGRAHTILASQIHRFSRALSVAFETPLKAGAMLRILLSCEIEYRGQRWLVFSA